MQYVLRINVNNTYIVFERYWSVM